MTMNVSDERKLSKDTASLLVPEVEDAAVVYHEMNFQKANVKR